MCRVDWKGEGKAEDDIEYNDVGACNPVDHESHQPVHPEPAWYHVLPPAQQVRQDRRHVRERREDHKRSHKRREGRLGSHVDAPEHRDEHAAEHNRSERIMCTPVHVGEEATARRRPVARQCPEHPAGCDAAADTREEGWQEGEKDEANGARLAPGRLPVDLSQREEV